jgi:hypothetical protein
MENKIPTTEELNTKMLNAIDYQFVFGGDNLELKKKMAAENCKNLAIEFVKLHVEAALKEASEKAKTNVISEYEVIIDKKSILNSYPLTNIK